MEIEIISKEDIKPSSPTPPHLKTFNLSSLDHLVGGSYIPLILFYPNNHNDNNILQALETSIALKKSLSKILTLFYPLAGTIKDEFSVDCNDVGARYVLTLVRCRLDDFLAKPDQQLINRFLPFEHAFTVSGEDVRLTYVQFNVFECGGIAIGLSVSHKILDASSLFTFVKAWADMVRGAEEEVVRPDFTAPSLFPAEKSSSLKDAFMVFFGSLFKHGKCTTKRFVFGSDSIAKLKSVTTVQQPSRVEVVSALIWKCVTTTTTTTKSKETHGFESPSISTHIVNLRRKLPKTLSKDLIGNVAWVAPATFRPDQNIATLDNFVKKVHDSILKIDTEFVNKAQGDEGYIAMKESLKEIVDEITDSSVKFEGYTFTSWCRMGFYGLDFGWGEPGWVSGISGSSGSVFINLINLMDTKSGEGIEAWVTLDEQQMKSLENNQEFLEFASLNPSLN